MTFQKDLIRNSIPYSCEQCLWQSCKECKGFIPDNMDAFLSTLISKLKFDIPDSKENKLIRHTKAKRYMADDKVTPLDTYYVSMINDSLWLIRHNQPAYVFTLGQVKEIMRFEKNITLRYVDGVYELIHK